MNLIFLWLRRAAPRPWFWLCAPLLLYSWTVTGPFISDDMHLILKAERYLGGESTDHALFRFARTDAEWDHLRNRGACPWWRTKGRQDFFRPIAEISFLADVALFGRNPLGYRLMSLGVFAIALLSVHWMFRSAGADAIRAGAATFFFGISQTTMAPVSWICNRADLFVIIGVTLAAGAYWSLRARPSIRWAVLAVVALAFGLLSKEAAIALCGVLILHEMWMRWRKETGSSHSLVTATVVILAMMTAGYFWYYLTSRPWAFNLAEAEANPSQFSSYWPLSILLYFSVWVTGFPIDALLLASPAQVMAVAVVGSLFGLVALIYLRKSVRNDPAAAFFAIWAILFILPALPALTVSARTLCVATVGWTYLLSGLILPSREEDVVIPALLRQWYYAANGVVSVGCIITMVMLVNSWEFGARERLGHMTARCQPGLSNGDLIVSLTTESAAETLCSADRLEFLTGHTDVVVAYPLPPGVQVSAQIEDSHTLLLRSTDETLFGSAIQRLALPQDWRPFVGDTIEMRDFKLEIAEVDDDDDVIALRLRFNDPISSPRLHIDPPQTVMQASAAGPIERTLASDSSQ